MVTLVLSLSLGRDSRAGISGSERNVLLTLYDTTDGDNWTNNSGWLGEPGSECGWFGIVCNEAQTQIRELRMFNNHLSGPIPPELVNLDNLQVLEFNLNQLTGPIPAELGELGGSLFQVFLNNNQLTGSIPPQLGNLSNLSSLILHSNQITGTIPPELGQLASLRFLFLRNNGLTGAIPPELGNLTLLQQLTLSSNDLSGSIPAALGSLANLQLLLLDDNHLAGPIPSQLGSLTNLTQLNLRNNELTGEIPGEIGALENLFLLDLSFNNLVGEIPAQLGGLADVSTFALGNNQLTGTIPPELGGLSSVTTLSLISNQLTGPIPPELGQLSSLIALVLSDNRLMGTIPPDLGNLTELQGLNLSSNQLTGPIPSQLGGLTNLGSVELRWNALYTTDNGLRDFLNARQVGGDWEGTQTIAPENLMSASSPLSVLVEWDSVDFTQEGGRYLVSYGTLPGGPYQFFGTTEDKLTTQLEVTGLSPAKDYFFVVQTQTDPHSDNQNTVTSDFSMELTASTEEASWVYGAGSPGSGPGAGFDGVAFTNISDAEASLELEAIATRSSLAAPGQATPQGNGDKTVLVLQPGEQTARLRSDLFEGDPAQPAWVEMTGDVSDIGAFFQFGTNTLSQLDGGVAIKETSTRVLLTRIFDGAGSFRGQAATTRISVLNPGPSSVTMEFRYRAPGGGGVEGQGDLAVVRTIDGRTLLDERALDLLDLDATESLSGGTLSGEVTEGGGVVAFEVVQLADQPTVLGLNAATGNPVSRAYSAQLASQPGLFTSVNVVNSSDESRNVTLRAVREDGTDVGTPVVIPLETGEQFTEDAGVLFMTGEAGQGPAQEVSLVGSLIVESDGDGVVGDVIFGDASNYAYAASLPLQSRAFTEALFNQVANISGFFTGLAFFYPGGGEQGELEGLASDAEITIQVFFPDGEMAGESVVTLSPGERLSRLVEQLVGEIELGGGYVRVVSTEPIIGQMFFGVVATGSIQLLSAVPPTVVQ